MNSNNNYQTSGGIGFTGALAILFIGLKLVGAIKWSWLWVLSPIWIPPGIFVGALAAIVAVEVIQEIAEFISDKIESTIDFIGNKMEAGLNFIKNKISPKDLNKKHHKELQNQSIEQINFNNNRDDKPIITKNTDEMTTREKRSILEKQKQNFLDQPKSDECNLGMGQYSKKIKY